MNVATICSLFLYIFERSELGVLWIIDPAKVRVHHIDPLQCEQKVKLHVGVLAAVVPI